MSTEPMSRQQISRLGGLATAQIDGGAYIRRLARKASKSGGRPRLATIDDVLGSAAGRRRLREFNRMWEVDSDDQVSRFR